MMRKSSPSVVCVAGPLKMGRSKHFSARVSVRSGYCADVTLGLYEERSLSEQFFLCFTCCQITELRGNVDMLRFGLPQLISGQLRQANTYKLYTH